MARYLCVTLAVLLFWTLPAFALDADGSFYVRGIGNESCAAYNIARQNHKDTEYQGWLAGYESAFNRWTADVWNIEANGDFGASLQWIDFYCRVHPSEKFGTAVENLIAFLYPTRLRDGRTAALPRGGQGSSLAPR